MTKSESIQHLLDYTATLARQLPYSQGQHRLAAIVTSRDNSVLGIGCNSYTKTHPRQYWYAKQIGNRHKIYLHAEIDAIIKAQKTSTVLAKIFIARVNRLGIPLYAKPCPLCQLAIEDVGIEECYWT